jgi:hypothetical protein
MLASTYCPVGLLGTELDAAANGGLVGSRVLYVSVLD